MDEFLSTPYGVAVFLIFDAVALLFAILITYRWLFKRIFDLLAALVCVVCTSPVWGIACLRRASEKKKGERERVFDVEERVGKKGKIVTLHLFENSVIKYLPRIFDVFCGRLSFIGCTPMTVEESETLSETEQDRFLVRPGLISPRILVESNEALPREELLKLDCKYAWNFGFFRDSKIFFLWLLKKIRGQ